jgi:hypothetical protein
MAAKTGNHSNILLSRSGRGILAHDGSDFLSGDRRPGLRDRMSGTVVIANPADCLRRAPFRGRNTTTKREAARKARPPFFVPAHQSTANTAEPFTL